MTNYSKLNPTQKELMAEFMVSHPGLAKNKLPSSVEGRAIASRLWEELSERLNAVGPPTKDAKMWRKVFADQKYQAKKKLSFNKASKQRTGGGPYTGKVITASEELLIEAAGLEDCIEEKKYTPLPDSLPTTPASTILSSSDNSDDEKASSSSSSLPAPSAAYTLRRSKTLRSRKNFKNEKLTLLQQNLKAASDFQISLNAKLDRLLLVQEKMLKIKEEKHLILQESHQINLQIKRLELETLQSNLSKHSSI
ncbi:uncharacterized protein LOC128865318 [Anastrepha ludens]|uniref:uncharacterized protein LOC128865318 n=1 Tax=Anastrepha ludens TaxID=28586 RepID=UPI0023B071E3|nr:uncharacterized protein LOC128865318 [Anastrepha ludens]